MINLRYHIVSITAVFLALGIGIAVGGTLIQRATVETLENRLDQQEERLDRTDGENAALRSELGERDALADELTAQGPALFAGHAADVQTVIVTVQGTGDDTVAATRSALRSGGAQVSGTLRFTGRWDDLDGDDVDALADLLDRRISNPDVVRGLVLARLADEMAAAAGPEPDPEPEPDGTLEGEADPDGAAEDGALGPSVDAGESAASPVVDTGAATPAQVPDDETVPDADEPVAPPEPAVPEAPVLDGLIERGLVEFLPEGAATPLVAFETRFVLVVDEGAALADDVVLLPLLEALSDAATTPDPAPAPPGAVEDDPDAEVPVADPVGVVVVAPLVLAPSDDPDEPDEVRAAPLVEAVRAHERVGSRVATVDAIEQFIGQAALVLVLGELEVGRSGHFGLAPDASALLPAARP
ncbi:MAG: copper transporter [Acidimicrobiales bacterium]